MEEKGEKFFPLSTFPFSDLLSRFYLSKNMFFFTLLSVKDIHDKIHFKGKKENTPKETN